MRNIGKFGKMGNKIEQSVSSSGENYTYLILGACLGMYLIVMGTIFKVSWTVLLKFVLLNLVSVYIPGIALYGLCGLKLSRVGQVTMSYALGYAFIVLEYFLSELFDRRLSFGFLTVFFAVVFAVLILYNISKNKTTYYPKCSPNEPVELFFLICLIGLNIFAYSARHLSTDVVSYFTAPRDMQYWVNNTVSLKVGWPADNLFMSGTPLNYHYFSNIPIAFLCEVYQIDVFTMSFPLYSMTKALLMFGGVQFMLECTKASKSTCVFGYVLVLFTTGAEKMILVTYLHHILLTPFGFDVGYTYGIIFIGFLVLQWDEVRNMSGYYVGMMLSWIMCVGAKAPIASVLILFAALLCAYWLLQRNWELAFGWGLSILLVFLVICKYCVGMFSVISGDAAWSLSIYDFDAICQLRAPSDCEILAKLLYKVSNRVPILAVLVRAFFVNPAINFAALIAICVIVDEVLHNRLSGKAAWFSFSLVLVAVCGLALGVVINAGGRSEMYFSMAALIPLLYLIFTNIPHFILNKRVKKYRMVLQVVFAILVIAGLFRFSFFAYNGYGACGEAAAGLKNILFASKKVSSDYGICNFDVEALAWIRDNADADALVMSDKAILTDNSAYYLYGIFCERHQYLEGTNMLDFRGTNTMLQQEISRRKEIIFGVYNNFENSIIQAKTDGVDYIVQTKQISADFNGESPLLELVAGTESMNIYRIK